MSFAPLESARVHINQSMAGMMTGMTMSAHVPRATTVRRGRAAPAHPAAAPTLLTHTRKDTYRFTTAGVGALTRLGQDAERGSSVHVRTVTLCLSVPAHCESLIMPPNESVQGHGAVPHESAAASGRARETARTREAHASTTLLRRRRSGRLATGGRAERSQLRGPLGCPPRTSSPANTRGRRGVVREAWRLLA